MASLRLYLGIWAWEMLELNINDLNCNTAVFSLSLSAPTVPLSHHSWRKEGESKKERETERDILLGMCKASWHSQFSPLPMLDSQMTRHQAGTSILQLCPVLCRAPSQLPSSDQLSPVLQPHTTPVTSSPPAFKQRPMSRCTNPPNLPDQIRTTQALNHMEMIPHKQRNYHLGPENP